MYSILSRLSFSFDILSMSFTAYWSPWFLIKGHLLIILKVTCVRSCFFLLARFFVFVFWFFHYNMRRHVISPRKFSELLCYEDLCWCSGRTSLETQTGNSSDPLFFFLFPTACYMTKFLLQTTRSRWGGWQLSLNSHSLAMDALSLLEVWIFLIFLYFWEHKLWWTEPEFKEKHPQ